MKDLLTLVDEEPHAEYEDGGIVLKAIDGKAFPATPAAPFWTSSVYAPDPTRAWVVDFATGIASPQPRGARHYVRCVRP
jgi:hypothetical protein